MWTKSNTVYFESCSQPLSCKEINKKVFLCVLSSINSFLEQRMDLSGKISVEDFLASNAPLSLEQLRNQERLIATNNALSMELTKARLFAADAVPDIDQQFDAIAANTEIQRLTHSLARLSLVHGSQQKAYLELEKKYEAIRNERTVLSEKCVDLSQKVDELETKIEKSNEECHSFHLLNQEVAELRRSEAKLIERLRAVEHGAPLPDYPLPAHELPEEAFEAAIISRQNELLTMFYRPLEAALHATVEFQLTKEAWDSECEMLREEARQERDNWAQKVETSLCESHELAEQNRSLYSALEAKQQELQLQQSYVQRLERQLLAEQQRSVNIKKVHLQELEKLHRDMALQRNEILQELEGEISRRLEEAFRNGRLYEREEKRKNKQRRAGVSHFPQMFGSVPSSVSSVHAETQDPDSAPEF